MKQMLLLTVFAASACTHTIGYELTDQDRYSGAPVSHRIGVRTLAGAATPAGSQQIDGIKYFCNARTGYPGGEYSKPATEALVRHLKHAGIFAEVVDLDAAPAGTPVDFELRGAISRFDACIADDASYRASRQRSETLGRAVAEKLSDSAQASLLGGLLGGGIYDWTEAERTTRTTGDVELGDLELYDVAAKKTVWKGRAFGRLREPTRVLEAKSSYHIADQTLKLATKDLITRLGRYFRGEPPFGELPAGLYFRNEARASCAKCPRPTVAALLGMYADPREAATAAGAVDTSKLALGYPMLVHSDELGFAKPPKEPGVVVVLALFADVDHAFTWYRESEAPVKNAVLVPILDSTRAAAQLNGAAPRRVVAIDRGEPAAAYAPDARGEGAPVLCTLEPGATFVVAGEALRDHPEWLPVQCGDTPAVVQRQRTLVDTTVKRSRDATYEITQITTKGELASWKYGKRGRE